MLCTCGSGGIRTPGPLSRTTVFKTVALNHSATLPLGTIADFSKKLNICYDKAMKYLGIDFGTKNIGLAVSDDGGKIAFPYRHILNSKTLVSDIEGIVLKEKVQEIILGHSSDAQGKENSVMEHVHLFKNNLEVALGLPVIFQKEFMTSLFARQDFNGKTKLHARQVKQKKQGGDDVGAAVLILQRYLDSAQPKL